MNTVDLLRKVRAYYDKPERWTKGAAARNRLGEAVAPIDPSATSFCLFGCITKETGRYKCLRPIVQQAIDELFHDRHLRTPVVVVFNDAVATTFKDVIAVLDRAIEIAEKEQV